MDGMAGAMVLWAGVMAAWQGDLLGWLDRLPTVLGWFDTDVLTSGVEMNEAVSSQQAMGIPYQVLEMKRDA